MLIFHAVQKLLNIAHTQASLYVTAAAPDQYLHSWYARLLPSGFSGKLLLMYVHEPSLMTVICRGKTLRGTWPEFKERLPALMKRFNFPSTFIETEMREADGYVQAKTNSKSMLAHMNQIVYQLEWHVSNFVSFDAIDQVMLEDIVMDYPYGTPDRKYITPKKYWEEKLRSLAGN